LVKETEGDKKRNKKREEEECKPTVERRGKTHKDVNGHILSVMHQL
jgi:hypothetical protein